MLLKAVEFAKNAHGNQVRKYTDTPYIFHTISVANIVSSVTKDKEVIAAAVLHDVIEDTGATYTHLCHRFGHRVANLVSELTEPKLDGNRATRKKQEAERLSKVSFEAKTIKLADLIDNTSSIVKFDEYFARTYMKEKKYLLQYSLADGDFELWLQAWHIVEDYYYTYGE